MPKQKKNDHVEIIKTWQLPASATLGSAVRAHGLLLELRAQVALAYKKLLTSDGTTLSLIMPEAEKAAFNAVSSIVSKCLEKIEDLPVIPREIQDILTISATERHRWLADGRLPSAGTRTVKLRGRAKKITFHVFDPKMVEGLLDSGVIEDWREDDAVAAKENRRRAAYKAKLTRSLKSAKTKAKSKEASADKPDADLRGWEDFSAEGFLR